MSLRIIHYNLQQNLQTNPETTKKIWEIEWDLYTKSSSPTYIAFLIAPISMDPTMSYEYYCLSLRYSCSRAWMRS